MLNPEDIEEEYEVRDVCIKTAYGWADVTRVFKTKPLPVWRLTTDTHTLEASKEHLVFTEDGWRHIGDLVRGDLVIAEEGVQEVLEVCDTGRVESLYDISVNCPSHAFYSGGILSHNSTTICTRMLMNSHMLPGYQGLYVVPNEAQRKTTADRLEQMESRFAEPTGTQNLYTKKYSNGSLIYMLHCGETANDARGKSSWEIIIDECAAYFTKLRVRYNEALDTYVNICDIAVGSEVMSFDSNGNITYDRVTGKQFKGLRDCYKVATDSGHGVVATANHKLRVSGGWAYVADIGRHNRLLAEAVREQAVETGWHGHVLEGQTCTCNAYRNPAWGRLLAESATLLPLEEVFCKPLDGPGGVRFGEGAAFSAVMPEREYHPQPWVLRYVGSYPDCDEVGSCSCSVLGTLLHETRSGARRYCKDGQACYGSLGCGIDMGSRSVVDTRRRIAVERHVHDFYAFVFGGGAVAAGGVDEEPWIEKGSIYGESVGEWKGIQCHKAEQDSLYKAGGLHKAVCASFHDVQGGRVPVQRELCVPGMWEAVQGNSGEGEVDGEVWPCILQNVLRGCEETAEGGVQAAPGRGGVQTEMEGGEGCHKAQEQRVRCCILPCEQGVYSRARKGEEEEGCSGRCCECTGCRMRLLPYAVQTYTCYVQGPAEVREARVYVAGLQEEAQDTELGSMSLMTVREDSSVEFRPVVSVVYCGKEEVWDIETEKHHAYVADGIGSHNCQSMSPEIVPDILECNQMSPLPLTLYTGTAMSTETLLEQEWQKSSQGIWHIKAGDGRTWLNMHDNDTLLKVCDNPRGPTCPITGKILDVTSGHYVHAYPNRIKNGYIGLHVPQVIIKDNVDTQLQWQKLYRKRQEYDPNKFLMECCGIAIAEGAREITQADLEKACSLPYTDEDILKKCRSGYYKLLVSGCDWGGSDENTAAKTKLSYTVHCVMGVAPNNMVDVLYFNRYTGMDYKSICKCIVDDHRKFCCDIMSGDDGVGLAYNTEMRDYLPAMTHFITRFTMPGTAPMAPIKNSSIVNHMALNKTEIVTNVFNDLKRGRLRFREWSKMQQFLTDFLNVYRAPMDSSTGGASRFRWMRSSGKADDALMALCFGYAYVKLFLGENIVADHATQRHVMDILNGHPGRSIAPPSRDFNYII